MKAVLLTNTFLDLDAIPSMGGREIGEFLHTAAKAVKAPASIVEVGAWLGAGTAQMAMATRSSDPMPKIHTYDMFTARSDEVRKAKADGISIELDHDTLPQVRSVLDPIGADITFHKGNILDYGWDGGPIGLYVDDAAKTPTLFYHVLDTFARSWIPGETIVVLMDYSYWATLTNRRGKRRLKVQQDIVERHPGCFEEIRDPAF